MKRRRTLSSAVVPLAIVGATLIMAPSPPSLAQATPSTTAPPTTAPSTTAPPTTAPSTTAPPSVTPGALPAPTSAAVPATTVAPPFTNGPRPILRPGQISPPILSTRGSDLDQSPYEWPKASEVKIGGPAVSVNTEKRAAFYFDATAGQSIAVSGNRDWVVFGPTNDVMAEGSTFVAQEAGRHLLVLGEGLRAPATVQVGLIDPSAIIIKANVGEAFAFSTSELQRQVVRIPVLGGRRYRLRTVTQDNDANVCIDSSLADEQLNVNCVAGTEPPQTEQYALFLPERDRELSLTAFLTVAPSNGNERSVPAQIEGLIELADSDVIPDLAKPIVELAAKADQRIVIPFWGSPSSRGVISTPNEARAQAWGDPWIDREDFNDKVGKVFAVPTVFNPEKAPFVVWGNEADESGKSKAVRYGVYRGEDSAASVPTNGTPVVITNKPWFASIASLKLEAGERYAIQITGTSIRPVSLAVRDPSGKFSSNLSPWQWTQDGNQQRAITSVTADRAGLWAVEMRMSGNAIRDVSVSVLKVGSGGSYQGSIDVDDVLTVGEKTDVQLGPNEFARFTVKLASATPQIIQPEVLRYRNNTFQPTAADLSIWDAKGRLVWSNNRNLEEEVLSGRLGKEPQLSERFATVASADPYTLIVSPKSDIAGRFRISITSTAVFSDVKLGDGAIPILFGGTRTGVVEVRTPTRYRVSGTSACISTTSTSEWSKISHCVDDGYSINLPVGVHRFGFPQPLTNARARFEVVPAGSPPDPEVDLVAVVDSRPVSVPPGKRNARIRFQADAGTRLVLDDGSSGQVDGTIVLPDGTAVNNTGTFVTAQSGEHILVVAQQIESPRAQRVRIRRAPTEIQSLKLSFNAKKPTIVTMINGQRQEAVLTVPKRSIVEVTTFPDETDLRANINFLYAANTASERRFTNGAVFEPGTYRFVFVGQGTSRINIKRKVFKGIFVPGIFIDG